jgi:branched-chain amino acid aminotransferase
MATTAPILWLDGALVPSSDARIPLMAHAAQRGSLVFDVGSFHPTARGPALFRAREHVARFLRSARIVGLGLSFDEETILRASVSVVAESGHDDGLIRWSAFFAVGEPDLVPRDPAARVAVAAQILDGPPSYAPIRVAIFDDARKAAPDVLSPEAKAAGAYLGPMLARQRAIAEGADDVVLLDRDGDIAEAPVSNAFAVVGGALWTPPLGRILPGITRDSVIAIAKAEGIVVREETLPLDVFSSADEAFLTSTSAPLSPIGWVNGRALGSAAVGPVTRRLLERLEAARHGDDPDRDAWLTFVR